jgi:hypothetical protein
MPKKSCVSTIASPTAHADGAPGCGVTHPAKPDANATASKRPIN